jgi:hypothetical protein
MLMQKHLSLGLSAFILLSLIHIMLCCLVSHRCVPCHDLLPFTHPSLPMLHTSLLA